MIRPIAFRDLSLLNRYRNSGLFLDSMPALTWGQAIVPAGALLSTFSSLTGVFTSIGQQEGDSPPLIGQVVHSAGSPCAHFTFLAPKTELDSPNLPELLEHLITQAGSRGVHSLIADVEEESPAFRALRKAGFGIYARQRIWRLTQAPEKQSLANSWRPANPADELSVNLLCANLVPGLVQQAEPAPRDGLSGYVWRSKGKLMAYADVRRGLRGQWLQPFVNIESEQFVETLAALLGVLRPFHRRPVYVCVRSYQDWLEPLLRELGAEPGPRQAVMAKRTTRRIKVENHRGLPAAEGRRAEPTIPMQMPNPFADYDIEQMSYDQTPNYR